MCGIFGYIGFEEDGLLRRMGEVIQHRGPDDHGYHEQGKINLGIRRLSIIDLEGGHQPIYNENNSSVVVYNGEIYNYLELSEELKRKGHQFKTHCDTEVIIHAYEEYGIDCLDRFNGMFAFALYDKGTDELIIARDRAGIKPLYYFHKDGRFIFASEIKAILESKYVERRCNESVIDSYLELRYVPQPETLFRDIKVLPGGHYLRLQSNTLSIKRYWEIRIHQGAYQSEEHYQEIFEAAFLNAVKLRMRSDVPVGAYLSSGIDSSLIVAAMTQFSQKVKTFSIGFDSPIDETQDARQLATHLNCDHQEIQCLPEHFALLPKVIWHLERPIGDALILAYYLLAQETSKHVKVVLAGEGADEIFAGYSFHKIIKLTQKYSEMVPEVLTRKLLVPSLSRMPVKLLDKLFIYPAYLGKEGKKRVVEYLRGYSQRSLNENYVYLKSLYDFQDRTDLYTQPFKARWMSNAVFAQTTGAGLNGKTNHFLDHMLKLQFNDWLQDNLLLRQDKNTMAHSLELRVPFLDHHLVELAFQMPAHLKIRGLKDKYIQRQMARKMLPKANVTRRKIPFYIPLEYCHHNSEIRELINLTLNKEQVERRGYFDYSIVKSLIEKMDKGEFLYLKQVMALVILELWHLIFIDKQRMW